MNIQRKKALQQRQITFNASELFDLYQRQGYGCLFRAATAAPKPMHSGELIAFLHHVHHIIDGMHRALGDRFNSSVAFQTQYVRNKILSIAALDYKIRHGAMGGS